MFEPPEKEHGMTLAEYKEEIKKATTREELRQISYKAFLQDESAMRGKRSLWDKVVTLCVEREVELGISEV